MRWPLTRLRSSGSSPSTPPSRNESTSTCSAATSTWVLTRMRLSEHAIHTWDIAVVLDPAATVAPDAVDLLIDTLGQLASRTGKPTGRPARVHVSTTDPERQFVLDVGESVSLLAWDGEERLAELRLPAEAFLRLIYGRLDPDHTPPADVGAVDLDQLRATFPGF